MEVGNKNASGGSSDQRIPETIAHFKSILPNYIPKSTNMIKALSFTFFLVVTFIACKDGFTIRKANQYDLIFYTNETGPKPKVGEHVFFQMDILDDKKNELQTYRNQRQMPSLKIPPSDSKNSLQNPIPAALIQMSVNDSVGIFDSQGFYTGFIRRIQ